MEAGTRSRVRRRGATATGHPTERATGGARAKRRADARRGVRLGACPQRETREPVPGECSTRRPPARPMARPPVFPPAGPPLNVWRILGLGQRATSKTVGTEFKLKSHSRLKTLAARRRGRGRRRRRRRRRRRCRVRGLCHLLAWRQRRRRRQSPDGERERDEGDCRRATEKRTTKEGAKEGKRENWRARARGRERHQV